MVGCRLRHEPKFERISATLAKGMSLIFQFSRVFVTFLIVFFGVGCDQVSDRLREKLSAKHIEQNGSSAGGQDLAPIGENPDKAAVPAQEHAGSEAVNSIGGPRGKISNSEITGSRLTEANKMDQASGLKTYRRKGDGID